MAKYANCERQIWLKVPISTTYVPSRPPPPQSSGSSTASPGWGPIAANSKAQISWKLSSRWNGYGPPNFSPPATRRGGKTFPPGSWTGALSLSSPRSRMRSEGRQGRISHRRGRRLPQRSPRRRGGGGGGDPGPDRVRRRLILRRQQDRQSSKLSGRGQASMNSWEGPG